MSCASQLFVMETELISGIINWGASLQLSWSLILFQTIDAGLIGLGHFIRIFVVAGVARLGWAGQKVTAIFTIKF